MKNKMFIYKITNLINNKIYIGLDSGPESEMRRWKNHQYSYKKHSGKSKLYSSMKKYGIENFICEIIDRASSTKELRDKEEYWIAKLDTCKSGLNIIPSANGGWTLADLSEEGKIIKQNAAKLWAKKSNEKKWITGSKEEIQKNLLHASRLHTFFGPGEKSKKVKENWESLSKEERYKKSDGLRKFWKNLSKEDKVKRATIGSLKALETNAKRYYVYDPNGNEHFVIGLGLFCKEHDIGENAMYFLKRVAEGFIHDFNGWKCIEIDKNTGEKILPPIRIKKKPGPKKKND